MVTAPRVTITDKEVFDMKVFLFAAAAVLVSVPTFAADVGVSVSVGQPGFYGHIEIGNFPQPQVVYAKPVVIQPVPVGEVREPIYLRVPPGHARNWKKHCHKYNACGQPVYFVKDDWYNDVYVPEYHKRHGEGRGRDERHGDDRDDDHGRDHGRDHDRGHGKD
jgi:hypothetical protein